MYTMIIDDGETDPEDAIRVVNSIPSVLECSQCSSRLPARRSVPLDYECTVESDERTCSPHSMYHEIPVWIKDLVGCFLGLMSGMFLIAGYFTTSFVTSMPPVQTCALRSLIGALLLVPFLIIFRPKLKLDLRTHLELIFLAIVFAAKFIAFTKGSSLLPIGEFSLLCNTVPIYTTVLGCLIERGTCELKKGMSCAVVTMGVITVFLPSLLEDMKNDERSMNQRAGGYAITLLSAIANAAALIGLGKLGRVPALWVSFYASVATSIISLVIVYTNGTFVFTTTTKDTLLSAAAGICTLMQCYLPALACVISEPSHVSVSMTLALVFSFSLQAYVQHRAPTIWTYIGAFLVLAAVILTNFSWWFFQEDSTPVARTEDDEEQGLLAHPKGDLYYGAVVLTGNPTCCKMCNNRVAG